MVRPSAESGGDSAESGGERLKPEDAFDIIGNETRLKILQVLFEEKFRGPVTFSELRQRVGVRDSSQFNFHLKKLDGPFIGKGDGGYSIRLSGIHVILTILTGSFTEHPRIGPFDTGGDCVACGGPLAAAYREEMVYVACQSCGVTHTMGMLPPSAVSDRTDEEMLVAFDRRQRHDFALAADGVCTSCTGTVARTLVRDPADMEVTGHMHPWDVPAFGLGNRYQCTNCDVWEFGSAGFHLLGHLDVLVFHRDHGVDLDAVPYWELDWVVGTDHTTIVAEDPLRVVVTIPLDDENLRVSLDEALAVTGVERVTAAP